MPVIDSRSDAKFDALVRTNKADALMSFIMATSNVKTEDDRKREVANRVKSAYELFRENIGNSSTGAGSYGEGSRDILKQFESHYTMGYEMGIWYDSNFHLNQLAIKVSNYEMTVSEYIGIVFLNLFSYFDKDGEKEYHHFLYEILNKAKISVGINSNISKEMIAETLPITKATEQANIIFNYLVDTDLFEQIDNNFMRLSSKWDGKGQELLEICNLEYKNLTFEEAKEKFKNKKLYAEYVSKTKKENDESKESDFIKEKDVVDIDERKRVKYGENILLYGVPGAGKSYTIQNEYCNDENCMERVVFHTDYTYSDFVGQILPHVSDGNVSYSFTSGIFTSILKKAYNNPSKEYFLVIEEINRGNAPAIFGDVFQLLDRDENGTSEYGISNMDIAKIVYGDENRKVRIPSNMSIIGTMNTSDQNVFTLDTAFQRRWDMRMIENSFVNVNTLFASKTILDTSVTWKVFCTTINHIILEKNVRMTSSEDKRLGIYFIHLRDLIYDDNANNSQLDKIARDKAERNNSRFPEKVLKYLWDDAFKFSREDIFEVGQYNSLESVIKKFMKEKNNARFTVFKENVYDAIVSPNTHEQRR